MGGMAAFIPSKDPEENQVVSEKVMADKLLETDNGQMEHGLLTQDYLTLRIMYFPTPLKQEILTNYMFYVKMTKLQKRI